MKHKKYWLIGSLSLSLFWACGNQQKTEENFQMPAENSESKTAELFGSKCSMCHAFREDKIGPSLAGVSARWGNDKEKLKAFIKNSQAVINSGDAYAIALYNKWNKSNMPAFPDLTDEELNALVAYLQ